LVVNAKAEAANSRFYTIKVSICVVSGVNEQLQVLVNISFPMQFVPTRFEFVDIAGLIKIASQD